MLDPPESGTEIHAMRSETLQHLPYKYPNPTQETPPPYYNQERRKNTQRERERSRAYNLYIHTGTPRVNFRKLRSRPGHEKARRQLRGQLLHRPPPGEVQEPAEGEGDEGGEGAAAADAAVAVDGDGDSRCNYHWCCCVIVRRRAAEVVLAPGAGPAVVEAGGSTASHRRRRCCRRSSAAGGERWQGGSHGFAELGV